ncbi:hypothetical protein [Cycloclasticus pugetii]|jgi:hypothetical protein|uniref:hypothetical protein n=1 Tax=Cycloclasticus pugetii TaxID=34068 RepID=UPI003A92E08D
MTVRKSNKDTALKHPVSSKTDIKPYVVPPNSGNSTSKLKTTEKIDLIRDAVRATMKLGVDQYGTPVLVNESENNPETNRLTSKNINKVIIRLAEEKGIHISRRVRDEIIDQLIDHADASGNTFDVYSRVKKTRDGCIIDVGCESEKRIIIDDGKVVISDKGCDALFIRNASMRPFVAPTPFKGDIQRLFTYLNMGRTSAWLLIAWMIYTLSTGREGASVYPILVITAEQGSSKSTLCELIIRSLVDPSALGIQGFPSDRKDLVIAASHAHVLIYDNLRYLTQKWSDILCIAATGGSDPMRKLFTDDQLVTHPFKVPLVLNGIHDFIEEPDLAQRCVFIGLDSMDESKRIDSEIFADNFNKDLPFIFKGMLELLAKVLQIVDTVELTHRHRMIRFMKYLAAIEQVEGLDKGSLQGLYADSFNERQRDVLMSDPLGLIIYEMVAVGHGDTWTGTPTELLNAVLDHLNDYDSRRRKLPDNPSTLSKRLQILKPVLLSQGVEVLFTRGKERKITITNSEAY